MSIYGCDLSNWQATLPDLSTYGFVFHKCTEGSGYVDPQYAGRQNVVRGLGKVWGAYHFMRMDSTPADQVANFTQHATILPGDVVVLDFENDGTWANYQAANIASQAIAIMGLFRSTYPNNRVLLYCNASTYTDYVQAWRIPTMDGLWVAGYGNAPNAPWLFWQYTDQPIDLDVAAFGTEFDLTHWAHMGDTVSGFLAFDYEQVNGLAWGTFEVGKNSIVASRMWVAVKALWGDVPNCKVTICDDKGAVLLSNTVTLIKNVRQYWQVPDGGSHVTFEWPPVPGTVVSGYGVWQ